MDKSAQAGVPGTRDGARGAPVLAKRVASPAEAVMQASFVAGLMACRDELGSQSFKSVNSMSCDEQLEAQREVPCL